MHTKNGAHAPMGSACLEKAKPSRRVAIHEAGHALAYWWNGQGIYSATARTKADMRTAPAVDRRGRESHGEEGFVEASSFIPAPALALEYGHHMPADLLQKHGYVEGEDVEALLCAITGESPEWRGNPLADLDKRGARHG